jgi:hypothetical protein
MSLITIVTVIPDFQGTFQQLAYFVFSYLKNNVFKNKPGTISVITDNCNLINWCPDFAKVIWKHEVKGVALCLEAEGRHFEHLL